MKYTNAALVVGLGLVSGIGGAAWGLAQDRKAVDPGMRVLLENDRVRVQEHYLKPGQKIAMHSHPDKVIYAINDWKVRETLADGTTRVVEGKAGEAKWGKATQHAVENIGTSDVRNIVIELKEPPPVK
jgi:quercetin dioxygenase-like cupin family protein